MRSPPGTSPTPVWPAASRRITTLRVKNGACAPLRFRSMLSRPATGMTSMSVIAGAAFLPGGSLRDMNLLTPAVPAADGITAAKGNGDLASLDRASSPPSYRVRDGGASYLEIESLLFELLIALLVVPVQPGGAVGHVLLDFVGFDQQIHREDLLAEIALVDLALEHRLVELLQLGQRELRREQLEADGLVTHLSLQPLQRHTEDFFVIEGEPGGVPDGKPGGLAGVGRRAHAVVGQFHQSIIGDGDDAAARIAVRVAESIELLEKDVADSGLLLQLAQRSVVEALVHAHESAGERPATLERLHAALNQQHFQITLVQSEYYAVHRHHGPGETHAGIPSRYFPRSCNSFSNPLERIGKRHQIFGSRFSSSRWKDGA